MKILSSYFRVPLTIALFYSDTHFENYEHMYMYVDGYKKIILVKYLPTSAHKIELKFNKIFNTVSTKSQTFFSSLKSISEIIKKKKVQVNVKMKYPSCHTHKNLLNVAKFSHSLLARESYPFTNL